MIIKKAEFAKSSTNEKECPKTKLLEFAFIGRSNVGKSSLINFITDRKSLAKTSVSPGKTRLINHFLVNDEWYLVDLPGYGYAKVGKKAREKFSSIISDYISRRREMVCLFVLIDSRHEPLANDLEFIDWLGESEVPFAIVFTKTDKLSAKNAENNVKSFIDKMLENWEEMPRYFLSSVKTRTGKEDILAYMGQIMDSVKKNKL
jgi:GTP-binding protein